MPTLEKFKQIAPSRGENEHFKPIDASMVHSIDIVIIRIRTKFVFVVEPRIAGNHGESNVKTRKNMPKARDASRYRKKIVGTLIRGKSGTTRYDGNDVQTDGSGPLRVCRKFCLPPVLITGLKHASLLRFAVISFLSFYLFPPSLSIEMIIVHIVEFFR